MKITCPFCKIEYAAKIPKGRRAECIVCGHVWAPDGARGRNRILMWLLMAAFALLVAVIAITMTTRYAPANKTEETIVVEMTGFRRTAAADGARIVISGRVKNMSGRVYGIPDIMLVLRDDAGEIVFTQRIMPPAPVLDIGEVAKFSHTLSGVPENARAARAEFVR